MEHKKQIRLIHAANRKQKAFKACLNLLQYFPYLSEHSFRNTLWKSWGADIKWVKIRIAKISFPVPKTLYNAIWFQTSLSSSPINIWICCVHVFLQIKTMGSSVRMDEHYLKRAGVWHEEVEPNMPASPAPTKKVHVYSLMPSFIHKGS